MTEAVPGAARTALFGAHNGVVAIEPLTVDRLERWALFGAHWRVVEVSPDRAVIDMCACTGELVERLETGDTALIEYLRARPANHD
jgi:hypothetical protein